MPEFLVYYLNHPITKLFFRAVETGKTQQNLSKTYIYDMLIPDVPKIKQTEIMKGISEKTREKKKLKSEIESLTSQTNKELWNGLA